MDKLISFSFVFLAILFFYLLNQFFILGGLNYPLLKVIVDLIIILFFMIIIGKKKKFRYVQKKIEDYFQINK